MIVHELKLDPFAGLSNLGVVFTEDLNVVLGPNEAGKTTLVNALKMALFTPTQYTKRAFDRVIKRFMPLKGGDTIRVELVFAMAGEAYRLVKSWGKSNGCQLILPGGGLLADTHAVQDKLQELLVLKEGTFNSVLFSYQSGLATTLDAFSEDSTATDDLAFILRRTVFETDGVSIETLKDVIQRQYDEYFGRWDPDLKRPQDNRGIDRPFQRGVGKILTAYYEKERLRRTLGEAEQYEAQVDELNRKTLDLSDEIAASRGFVDENRPVVEDVRRRILLEAKKKAIEEEEKRLRDISQKWPALEQELKNGNERLEELSKRHKTLGEELRQAESYETNKRKIERLERAKKKKQKLDEALGLLGTMKAIGEKDYRSLERLHTEIDRLKTSLQAGKIALSMLPEKPTELQVVTDFEEETSHNLQAGQTLELQAGGEIQIRHVDWTLNVRSGEVKFDEVKATFDKLSRDYEALLHRLGITDFIKGREAYEAYKQHSRTVETLRAELEETLEGESYQALEELARTIPLDRVPRQPVAITKEQGENETAIALVERDLESKTAQMKEWEEEYTSQDNLLDLLLEKRAGLKECNKELGNLKPLPEWVEDPELFIQEFDGKQEKLKEKEAQLYELRIERAELEGQAPEETREETEVQLRDAERRFEQVEKEAAAVAEILITFRQIKSTMDTRTLDPWLAELERTVAPLTVSRYKVISLAEDELGKAVRADGLEIPFEALSIGTKVGLGLALRLSMARYFLQGLKGFLILDDPLVDLDPERQEAAVEVIQEFAKEKQVIVLTCDPRRADLMGGHLIRLESSA